MTLGDKIVVMDDGHVQQIGTPHEIYNEPANRFVADFIGSPSPNLIDCTVDRTASGITFESEFCTLPATEKQAEAVREWGSETVVYGVRPEYLNLRSEAGHFEADLDVIEPLGDRDAVHLSANGTPMSAVTPQGEISKESTRISVEIQTDEAWLFNESGERIV